MGNFFIPLFLEPAQHLTMIMNVLKIDFVLNSSTSVTKQSLLRNVTTVDPLLKIKVG